MLTSLLVLAAACGSTSDRGGHQPSSTTSSQKSPDEKNPKPSGRSTNTPSGAPTSAPDRKAKPKVDIAKASPGGLTVRYLKDGKVDQVDVPDFER